MPASTSTRSMRHLSAPPTLPIQAPPAQRSTNAIRQAMDLSNLMNNDASNADAACSSGSSKPGSYSLSAANEEGQAAAEALLGLSAPESNVPSRGATAPVKASHNASPHWLQTTMPPSPPDTGSSSYAPSPVSAPADGEDSADDEDSGDNNNNVAGDPNHREFECRASRNQCMLGQYTLICSRKMVSDYFGRNKKETYAVEDDRWIRWCRKHYQRRSYRDSWAHHKGKVVIQQLHAISAQEPGLCYRIGLKAGEEKRLQDYYATTVAAGRVFDPNAPDATAKDDDEPENAPFAVLREIKQFNEQHARDEDGTVSMDDCEQLIHMTMQMVKDKRCLRLPQFEMLPQFSSLKAPKFKAKSGGSGRKKSPRGNGGGKGKGAAGTKRKSGGVEGGSSTKRQRV